VSGVLFVDVGRDQRAAIVQARERGLHVVAVDPDLHAEGFAHADVAEVADTDDATSIEEIARLRAYRRGHDARGARRADHAAGLVAVEVE
jgi:hypothetical protein